jgi:hypothetical protein
LLCIHLLASQKRKTWMPGTSPGMTALIGLRPKSPFFFTTSPL